MTQLPIALPVPANLSFRDWSDMGARLLAARRTVNWLIGDWLIAGLERHGDKARDEAHRLAQADIERFGPIVETCRRFPEPQRHAALTFGHHLAVMAVSDDSEALRMLDEAERENASVAALKARVRVATDRQVSLIEDDDPSDTQMRRIAQAWNNAGRDAREAFLELAMEAKMGVIDL